MRRSRTISARRHLDDYIGQEKAKEMLNVYIRAARERGDALDHVLVLWPAGTWQDNTCRDHCQ